MKCNQVPSILADSTRYSVSLPKRETGRGWSWFDKYRLFQPRPASSFCQRVIVVFRSRRSSGL